MEQQFKELLEELPDNMIKNCLAEYISKNNLHSTYIEFITKLNKNYIEESNNFIVGMKQCINMLYTDKHGNKKVLKNVDIDKDNWYWYARLLKYSEDEKYLKQNFLQPTYLLKRLKPITDTLTTNDLKKDELIDLYNNLLELYKKYKIGE